jgi:hypothetical protein
VLICMNFLQKYTIPMQFVRIRSDAIRPRCGFLYESPITLSQCVEKKKYFHALGLPWSLGFDSQTRPWVGSRSPDGWDQIPRWAGGLVLHQPPWSFGFDSQTRGTRENRAPPCVKVPGSSRVPPRSLVCDGQTSPDRPWLIASRSTCLPLSPSAHANSFVIGTAAINTHTNTVPAIVSTSTRMHGNFCVFSFYRLTGRPRRTSRPLECHRNRTHRFKRAAFFQSLKSKVGLAAAKAAALRINLNTHGCGIVAAPVHAPRAPFLLPLFLLHNIPFPRVH